MWCLGMKVVGLFGDADIGAVVVAHEDFVCTGGGLAVRILGGVEGTGQHLSTPFGEGYAELLGHH
jgi:hypothetical protein